MNFNPQNILINDFGQTGDVILSLPALRAVRERFPDAKITVLVSKASADIIEISNFADEKIVVDRAELRHSNTLWSIWQLFKLVADVRRREFDFVIDFHSFYETNILGFLSGAKHRLFSNRETRSLDFLSNFRPKPPLLDKSKHVTDYYLDTLKPLGVENAERVVEIKPRSTDFKKIESLLQNLDGKKIAGIFPGAGNPLRRWGLENFAGLAKLLSENENLHIIVFLGPEEKDLRAQIEGKFPDKTTILDKLTLLEFMAAVSMVQILISNDTSAIHIGAIMGTPTVVVMEEHTPPTFLPLTKKASLVRGFPLTEIGVEKVFQAAKNLLTYQGSSNEISQGSQSQSS